MSRIHRQGLLNLPRRSQLDLSGTTADHVHALNELERACEAATFGRNQETVLDESYRKAGKMDVERFMSGLDVDKSGLLDVVRSGRPSYRRSRGQASEGGALQAQRVWSAPDQPIRLMEC